jgi:uncharacterized protein (DUF2236 family)
VQGTAAFGFLEAYHAYVRPLRNDERDRYYAEGQTAARLYGARDAPASQVAMEALFARMHDRLEPSDIVHQFLDIVRRMPGLAAPLRPLLALLIRAAVDIVPPSARERLGLQGWRLAPWQRGLVGRFARGADRLLLCSSAAVQSCRRLELRDDFLYAESQTPHSGH